MKKGSLRAGSEGGSDGKPCRGREVIVEIEQRKGNHPPQSITPSPTIPIIRPLQLLLALPRTTLTVSTLLSSTRSVSLRHDPATNLLLSPNLPIPPTHQSFVTLTLAPPLTRQFFAIGLFPSPDALLWTPMGPRLAPEVLHPLARNKPYCTSYLAPRHLST